ncbi:MAG TPA: DUF1343 domain-containing protein [Polyangiaceae bacterium]
MLCGVDQLLSGPLTGLRRKLRSARVGLVSHAASIDRRGHHTRDVLEELGVSLRILFAPEHGFEADAQAEEAVATESANGDGHPRLVSLYGKTREDLVPRREDLAEIDLLIVDLADVGSRYYTYVWTALLAARAAREAGIHTLVLDRPNPISGDPASVEGAPQDPGFLSFVGLEPLPIRHALTVGEIIALFFERDGQPLGQDGALSVVPVAGWERYRTAQAWGRPFVMPSPNMPTIETALVYPGGCLIEGTNLSEGRGTTAPFQLVGAPFLDGQALAKSVTDCGLLGVLVRPATFRPAFEKHAGQRCHGVMLHVTSPELFRPVETYLTLIALARAQVPDRFEFRSTPYEFESAIPAFDLLTGSARAREALMRGATPAELAELVLRVDPSYRERVAEAEARLERASA